MGIHEFFPRPLSLLSMTILYHACIAQKSAEAKTRRKFFPRNGFGSLHRDARYASYAGSLVTAGGPVRRAPATLLTFSIFSCPRMGLRPLRTTSARSLIGCLISQNPC